MAERTVPSIGWVKGEPKRFIHGHQSRKPGPKYEVAENGCWLWLGSISQKGYGYYRPHGAKRMHPAHRVFYERARGPIPEGMQLDHLCHTNDPSCPGGTCLHRRCVNPDHLEIVTGKQNAERGRLGKRANPEPRPKRSHCKRGHEFTPENTIIGSDGARRCRTCDNAAQLRSYYKRKAKAKVGAKTEAPAPTFTV